MGGDSENVLYLEQFNKKNKPQKPRMPKPDRKVKKQ